MMEFESGQEELSFNVFSYEEDFKTREFGTNEATMNKILSFVFECRNNKAVIFYLTNQQEIVSNQAEKAEQLLFETTTLRIQLLPTVEDYFQLGLIYSNIAGLESSLDFHLSALEIFENLYADLQKNAGYFAKMAVKKAKTKNAQKTLFLNQLIDGQANFL